MPAAPTSTTSPAPPSLYSTTGVCCVSSSCTALLGSTLYQRSRMYHVDAGSLLRSTAATEGSPTFLFLSTPLSLSLVFTRCAHSPTHPLNRWGGRCSMKTGGPAVMTKGGIMGRMHKPATAPMPLYVKPQVNYHNVRLAFPRLHRLG